MATKLNKEGSQTCNIGTEHIIADYTAASSTNQRWFSMWLDTTAMQAGDTLEVKSYVAFVENGTLRLYRNDIQTDAQSYPAWYLPPMPNYYGFRITLKQTSGTSRTFPYLIFEQ